jgi:hypothetical protein
MPSHHVVTFACAPVVRCRSLLVPSLSLLLLLAACEQQPVAPPEAADPQGAQARGEPTLQQVPDQYIIRFRDDVVGALGLSEQLERAFGFTIRHRYAGAVNGFSATIPPAVVEALRSHPLIASIEPNYVIQLSSEMIPAVPTEGLRVHVVAEDLAGQVADGAGVSTWPNRGSAAAAAQQNSSKLPTFHAGAEGGPFGGRAHVGFNEGTDNDETLLIPGVTAHGSGTLIAVFRQEDATAHNYELFGMWGSSTNRGSFGTYRSTSPNRLHYWDQTNQWQSSSFTPAAGTQYVAVWRVKGSQAIDFQVNGQAQGSAPIGSNIHQPFDRYILGASEPSTSSRFDGQVAELLFYDRALADCERDQVVADLGAYYGIAVATSGGACNTPADPSGLTATATSSTAIDLSWSDNSSNETGFAVERRQGSGSFAEVARVGANVTAHSSSGLSASTQYCYRVRAFNADGSSGYSATACATTAAPPPAPPPVPVPAFGLRVRVVGEDLSGSVADGAVVSTWPNRGSSGAAAQQSSTQQPAFHAGVPGGPFGGRANVGFNEGSDNDETLLIPGVTPHGSGTLIAVFRQEDVSAHNYELFGMWGSSSNRGSFGTYRSSSPNRLHYWDQTNQWLSSSFTPAAGGQYVGVWRVRGSEAIDFQVNGQPQGSTPLTSDIHQPFDRYVIGASEPSTTSRFDGQVAELLFWDRALADCERDKIVADLGGYYGISVATSGSVVCNPPADPVGLSASASEPVVVSLSWMDASTNETGFAIERRPSAGSFAEIAKVGPGVTAYSDVGLLAESAYCYRVRAFNGDGGSGPSNESCVTLPAPDVGACVDTGPHDSLAELWNINKVRAHENPYWKASQRAGCEMRAWFFGIDSGVDSDHPDLNVAETRNFVAAQEGHSGEDGNGHGTHTAGSAAARDGNGGVVGVAPGARVYGFRVCTDEGQCSYDDIIAAVNEVWTRKMANPSQPMVASLSLAGPPTDIMDTAIRRLVNAGVTVVMAAGNGFLGTCLLAESATTISPARTGDDAINGADGSDGNAQRVNGAITVTSSDANDRDVNCNYGNPVTVAAPGVNVKSTWFGGGYRITSGTSMATPQVAGAAILYMQGRPSAAPREVEQAIVNRLAPWTTNEQPNALGRLDAGRP